MKVNEAITAVMEDVGAVRKDGRNNQQNFNFRGIDAVVNAVSPAMRKHGLVVRPTAVTRETSGKQLSGGKMATSIEVTVDYTFTGPEGDSLTTQVVAEAFDLGDKATAKAMSVALRTCLLQTFMLPTDDKDPDSETYERASHQPQRQQAPTPGQVADKALADAGADLQKLQAVRHWATGAGAPQEYLDRVEAAITKAQETQPLEGTLIQ
jgi:hypothetical protein